jgi:hypothetical protein
MSKVCFNLNTKFDIIILIIYFLDLSNILIQTMMSFIINYEKLLLYSFTIIYILLKYKYLLVKTNLPSIFFYSVSFFC